MYKFCRNMYILFSLLMYIIKCDAKVLKYLSEPKHNVGFKHYPEVGWIHYHPMPLQWAEARLRCFYEDAELMSPNDEQMLKVMADIPETNAMWTGVHSTYSKGDYFSITGVPLSEMPITWAKDEPNNENNDEECLIMLPGGYMADCKCNETYAFSCYKPNNLNTFQCGSISGYELDHRTNNCYKFHNIAQNWTRAFMICAAEGAHLAVIDSPGETQVLQDIYSKYPANIIYGATFTESIHLGFRDWENHRLWMTINGKNIDDLINKKIVSWKQNEPNNVNEKCGNLLRNEQLNDADCNALLPFICEFEN